MRIAITESISPVSHVLLRILLRVVMLVVLLILAVLWSATTAHAAEPIHLEDLCDDGCDLPSAPLQLTLFLPALNRAKPPTAPPTLVDPQPVWGAELWQWMERLGYESAYEQGDVDCSRGQNGSVWFLAGAIDNAPKTRNCTVPAGKTLLAPLFTILFYNAPGENYSLEEKRIHLDEAFSDEVPGLLNTELCRLESTIDGTPFDSVRLLSPPFAAQGDPEALADGFYLAFQLAPGEHQVYFTGVLCQFGSDIEAYVVDITYNLIVTE